jgi:hypothetical protein
MKSKTNYMKPLILFLSTLLCLSFTSEEEGLFMQRNCVLEHSEFDPDLNQNEAVFKFTFKGIKDSMTGRKIDFSINGVSKKKKLTNNSYLEIKVKPGKYKFQFFYNGDYERSGQYYEVYSDSLSIKNQYRDDYSIYFENATIEIMTDKPIIYLYPENEIDVEVIVDIKGSNPFFYPKYENGWRVKASPDGTIHYNSSTYNYLFWEATNNQPISYTDRMNGFVVSREETISFLEEKLTLAGLNTKEQADFITYWGPRLIKNKVNFIHFVFNGSCDKFAVLNITPKPDNVYRIYMLWAPVGPFYEANPQNIVPMNRNGFTVIEWGGQEHSFQLTEKIVPL